MDGLSGYMRWDNDTYTQWPIRKEQKYEGEGEWEGTRERKVEETIPSYLP